MDPLLRHAITETDMHRDDRGPAVLAAAHDARGKERGSGDERAGDAIIKFQVGRAMIRTRVNKFKQA